MSRLGMLYGITNDELSNLEKQSSDNIYDYMMENIEELYFGTEKACELDKAWYGLHYAFNNGKWTEDDSVTSKIIFSGKFLLDSEDYIITIKTSDDIKMIVDYLNALNSLEDTISKGFNNTKAEDLDLPKDDNLLSYLIGWSSDIVSFYKNALDKKLNVIFAVDL